MYVFCYLVLSCLKYCLLSCTFLFEVMFVILYFSFSGEWLLMFIYLFREQIQDIFPSGTTSNTTQDSTADSVLEKWRLQNLPLFLIMSISVSFLLFWGIGGFFQYYFYIKRRHKVSTHFRKYSYHFFIII